MSGRRPRVMAMGAYERLREVTMAGFHIACQPAKRVVDGEPTRQTHRAWPEVTPAERTIPQAGAGGSATPCGSLLSAAENPPRRRSCVYRSEVAGSRPAAAG